MFPFKTYRVGLVGRMLVEFSASRLGFRVTRLPLFSKQYRRRCLLIDFAQCGLGCARLQYSNSCNGEHKHCSGFHFVVVVTKQLVALTRISPRFGFVQDKKLRYLPRANTIGRKNRRHRGRIETPGKDGRTNEDAVTDTTAATNSSKTFRPSLWDSASVPIARCSRITPCRQRPH